MLNLIGRSSSPPPREQRASRFDSRPNAQGGIADRRMGEAVVERQERQLRERQEEVQDDYRRGAPVGRMQRGRSETQVRTYYNLIRTIWLIFD